MDRTIIVNCFHLNDYMFKPFHDGSIPADLLVDKIKSSPFGGQFLEVHPSHQNLTLGFSRCVAPKDNLQGFWTALKDILPPQGETWIIRGDLPLLDLNMLEDMMALHHKYYAQYTFADAWPFGLAGDIIRNEILPEILEMVLTQPALASQCGLFDIIQRDINRFDLETLVAPQDYRPWRLDLSLKNKEGWLLADAFLQKKYGSSLDLPTMVDSHEFIFRTIPSYVQIQLSEQCPQSCSYCPYPSMNPQLLQPGRNMTFDEFSKILHQVKTLNPQAQISLSPWGEASLNPHVYKMIQLVMDMGFSLLVETSGLGWDQNKLQPLLNQEQQNWIISMDAQDPDLYKKLRGEGQQEVLGFMDFLENQLGDNLYCQVVRSTDNEEDLEGLYQWMKQRKSKLLVQKYDHFSSALPHKKITDLSPVKRQPCWHNKRDLLIMADGRVPQCREDIKIEHCLGNLFQEDLSTIWKRGEDLYKKQINKEYPGICGDCDEYYCYNF
ncbi:MAG: spiro-SPASM protein [Spirochaetaceae bacterium]|jgi:spiro-SPASM protein|nr:spiro-SPASM protein [Spirochaetaceae bacterium]